jgi:hypothetical protein
MQPLMVSKVSRTVKRLGLLLSCLLVLNLAVVSIAFFNGGNVPTAHAATYKVLFDASHAETAGNADWIISTSQPNPLNQNANPQVETDWTGAISAWGVALQKTGRYSLMTLPSGGRITYGDSTNTLDLKNFNEFVVPEPNIIFTASEKTAILQFVQNGGGLFMVADHQGSDRNNDGYDSLQIWNDLMSNNSVNSSDPFGFSFDSLNIVSENPNGIPASASSNPVIHGPFGTATGSIIRNGTTETINPTDNPNVKGLVYRTSFSTTGTTGVFFLTSTFGAGRVAAWGDSSAIDDGTASPGNTVYNGWNDPAGTDDILALNATEWLAQGGSSPPPTTTVPTTTTTLPPTTTTVPPTTTTTTVPPTTTTTTVPPTTTTVPPTTTTVPPTTTPTSSQLISNGGFESGSAGWTESSTGGYEIVDSITPHTGSNSADLCGYNNCTDTIYQTITIPSNITSATLSYYDYITTQETSHSYDYFYAQVRNTSGTVLKTCQTFSDGSGLNKWYKATCDLSAYKGSTVQIYFKGTADSTNPTEFFVDDVSVVAQ